MPKKPTPPPNTYWRGNTLWGRAKVAGVERRWSLRTDDPEVAVARFKAIQQREIAAARFGDQRVTWEEAYDAWGENIASSIKPSTLKRYVVSLKQLNAYLAGMYLDEIDKTCLSDVIRKRRGAGATNATIRRDLTALSSVLSFAEDEEWVGTNVALARMKRVKERREPIVLPDLQHIQMVVDIAPGNLARMTRVALLTGCRQAELSTLERRHIDHDRRQLTIKGKGSKVRTLSLSDEAYEVIRTMPVNMRGRAVFWHGDGSPYLNVSSRFSQLVKVAQRVAQRKRTDFRPFRFHDLRHRFAVDYLKAGGSIYILQQHLGHSSVKTTEMYLAYLTPEEAMAAKRLSAAGG